SHQGGCHRPGQGGPVGGRERGLHRSHDPHHRGAHHGPSREGEGSRDARWRRDGLLDPASYSRRAPPRGGALAIYGAGGTILDSMTMRPARRPHAESSMVTAQLSNPAIAAVTSTACTSLPSGRNVAPRTQVLSELTSQMV